MDATAAASAVTIASPTKTANTIQEPIREVGFGMLLEALPAIPEEPKQVNTIGFGFMEPKTVWGDLVAKSNPLTPPPTLL